MFVGHLAPAFVAKTIDREIPLWVLVFAALLLDVIWSIFVLLGIERIAIEPGVTAANPLDLQYVPFSHSLTAAGIWSLVAAMGYANFVQWGRVRGLALVVGGTAFAHWCLDLLVHRPDLPIIGTSMKVGLGLWDFPVPAFVLELALFVGAVWWLLLRVRLKTQRLRIGLPVLASVLVAVQAMAAFGPPPPSVTAVAVSGVATPLVIAAAAYWLEGTTDRGRVGG